MARCCLHRISTSPSSARNTKRQDKTRRDKTRQDNTLGRLALDDVRISVCKWVWPFLLFPPLPLEPDLQSAFSSSASSILSTLPTDDHPHPHPRSSFPPPTFLSPSPLIADRCCSTVGLMPLFPDLDLAAPFPRPFQLPRGAQVEYQVGS